MSEIKPEAKSQDWLIPPEANFSRLAEDMAQSATENSDVFLETKVEARAALDKAFKDAEEIFVRYLPEVVNRAVSTEQFRNSLPSEPMGLGKLLGRKGLLASRTEKAKHKAAIHAAYDARRVLIELKHFYTRTYDQTIRQIETARRNAGIGIPYLPNDTRNKLEYLHGVERAQLSEAVSEHSTHIAEIEAFQEAVMARFGLAHKIFGQTDTALTEEQRVHFEVLRAHEQDIRKAQSLVRSIALLGDDDEPPKLLIEQEWDHGR